MYCPYCGKENNDPAKFCTGCGRNMEQSRKKNHVNRLADPITGEAADSFSENSPARKKRKFRVILAVISLILVALLISGLFAGKYVQKERQWRGYYDLGSQYLSEANYEEAIVAFTNAIEIDDRKPEAYTGRGDAYTGSAGEAAEAQNFNEAVDLYEKALDDYEKAVELGDSEAEDKVQKTETNIEQIGSSSAEYTIEREDRSIYDDSGQLLASWYYDKVVLEEVNEQFTAINEQIQEDCDRFFAENPDYESDVFASSPQDGGMTYSNYCEAEVTCNENDILSIRITQMWFMGGVANMDYYGLSYDLYTGKEVSLENLLSMSSDAAGDYLKEETIKYIDENPDMGWWSEDFADAKQTVTEYDLQEFEFYIEDHNVCLCYPTYELGPGAMGAVVVECPITAQAVEAAPAEKTGGEPRSVQIENAAVSSERTSGERDIVLVLDISSSMAGEPIEETKKAAVRFIETILSEEANIGIVTYDSSAQTISEFSDEEETLTAAVEGIRNGGSTNIEDGLRTAYDMLQNSRAEKQIIVLMSDGEPNEGKIGEDLISYAGGIKERGVTIYTLGFFESLMNKAAAQALMEGIASSGCHYEVADAESLIFFFGDIADQINGQKYIYIRIACPVDVSVSFGGETLNSSESALSTRTDFGTLTFEEYCEEGSVSDMDDSIKILRLKEGADYDVLIVGTGLGTMDYTIGFMDENGEYSDQRKFENVAVNGSSIIDTVASDSEKTILNIDEDGDGTYDLSYEAGANETGRPADYSYMVYIAGIILALIIAAVIAVRILTAVRRRKRQKARKD